MIRQSKRTRPTLSSFLILASVIGLSAHSQFANAARITQVKGDQVLVDLEGSSDFVQGERYLVIVDGKRKAVVELTRVKGSKGIGKTLKGVAAAQGTLAPLSGPAAGAGAKKTAAAKNASQKTANSKPAKSRARDHGDDSFSELTVGAVAGMNLASQDVTQGGTTVAMTGNGFSLKGFADLPIAGELGLIGRFGLEKFGVTGKLPNSTEAKTDIMYVTADLLLRYHFLEGDLKVFPLAGIGLHYPISKTTNALQVQQISATTVFFVGGGAHYRFNENMYALGTVEYGIFPPSNDVKTSLIAFRGGVGWLL